MLACTGYSNWPVLPHINSCIVYEGCENFWRSPYLLHSTSLQANRLDDKGTVRSRDVFLKEALLHVILVDFVEDGAKEVESGSVVLPELTLQSGLVLVALRVEEVEDEGSNLVLVTHVKQILLVFLVVPC